MAVEGVDIMHHEGSSQFVTNGGFGVEKWVEKVHSGADKKEKEEIAGEKKEERKRVRGGDCRRFAEPSLRVG